jgi:aspartate aminotransferase-like enzyme
MSNAKLFTPGPTAVPPEVLEAQARPLIHHRTEPFRDTYREVMDDLAYIIRTHNPVVVLASSGTGAMESAVVNMTQPKEKVLVTVNGKFSERWKQIAEVYGVQVVSVEAEWGDPVTPDRIEATFDRHPDATALFTTHSETSTGVLQDVGSFARIAHGHDALIVVDAISSVCAHDVLTDDWRLDVVVGGSQKGTMTPPGLAYVSLSPAAIEKARAGRQPCYYFDLLKAVDAAKNGDTPYTPATSLMFAFQQALRIIRKEGIENVIARHAANADAVRAAVDALGLKLLSSAPSNATTAVRPPDGTAARIVEAMDKTYGVKVAGGQAKLKGKIFRLGHLGDYHRADMQTMIAALEGALSDLGVAADSGAGIRALDESFSKREV